MTRQFHIRLRSAVFLWVLLVITTLVPLAMFAYDGQSQTKVSGGNSDKAGCGYDAVPVLTAGEKKNVTTRDRALFAKFAEFLAAKTGTAAADDAAKWIWGQNKGVAKSIRQMDQRGWNPQQVTEAIKGGQQFPAQNLVNKGNEAIRYVHPQTGQSVVQDTMTKEIIHFGGPGFKY